MSKAKSAARKKHLGVELKRNKRIPVFVIAKTNRKVTTNLGRRHWRTRKMKLKIK